MKRSCGFTLAVWALLVGAYGYLAWLKVHEAVPTAIIALLGGTFAAALVGSFAGLFAGARDRAAIARAIKGDPPRDGRLEAASGPIRPSGAPLHGPFTGRPSVAYEYDVKTPGAKQSDFAGVALAPCAVDTPWGSARLLGWAILDQFERAPARTIDVERGTSYLQGATLERLGPTSILSVLGELLADGDGAIQKDFQIGASSVNLDNKVIDEKIVPVGARVTVLGRWSASQGGFASAGTASMNRIFPGDLPTTARHVGGTSVKAFATGVFFFVALHAILVPMYLLAPRRDAHGEILPAHPSVLDERDCDRQQELLAAGADPNELGRLGSRPLMNAAREGSVACVQHLVASGARLEDADWNGNTALAQALMANREETAGVLRQAGAKDFRITAETGRPLADDAEPFVVVKEYIAAVHRGDFETTARLAPGSSVRRIRERSDDLALWQSMRPKDPKLASGWMTDAAATLTLYGETSHGEQAVSYHLEKSPEGWQIRREWLPESR